MDKPLIEARQISKTYASNGQGAPALSQVSFAIQAGETLAITGPSGAGKSTLLHLLGLMDRPTSGTLRFLDQDTASMTEESLASCRNGKIGFLFQFHYLLPELTILENAALPLMIQGVPESKARERALDRLKEVGVDRVRDQLPSRTSGGEQQRAALARALINDPVIILADEPTGNLDRKNGEAVIDLLWRQSRQRNAAVVVVTHQPELSRQAHRCLNLCDGNLVKEAQHP